MFHYAENDVRMIANKKEDPKDDNNKLILWNAGYRRSLDEAAQKAAVDAHKVFLGMGISQSRAHNPYQWFERRNDGTFQTGTDVAFNRELMEYAKNALGDLYVNGNNSLDNPTKPANAPLYNEMSAFGGMTYFQTENTDRYTPPLYGILMHGADLGAMMIELPGVASHYTSNLTQAEASQAKTALLSNVPTA